MSKKNGVGGSLFDVILQDVVNDMPSYQLAGHTIKIAKPGYDTVQEASKIATRLAEKELLPEKMKLEKERINKAEWEEAVARLKESNPTAKVGGPPKNRYEQIVRTKMQEYLLAEIALRVIRDSSGTPLPEDRYDTWKPVITAEPKLLKLVGQQLAGFKEFYEAESEEEKNG